MRQLLRARWVAPMCGPLIENAGLLIEAGRILEVGTANRLRRIGSGVVPNDLGDVVVLPGLVNAHTHLELSDCQVGDPPADFSQWLSGLFPRTQAPPPRMAELVQHAIQTAVAQCLRFGVTTVGDISRQHQLTRPLLRAGPLRVVSFGEVMGFGTRRDALERELPAATDLSQQTQHLRIGLTPHAPYTVEIEGYRKCVQWAAAHGLPLATHLAETPDETPLLAEHSGPFRQLWDNLGAWDDRVPRYQGGPIRLAQAAGLLDYPTLLAHVNYCDDQELAILAAGRASVVYCPRTHAWFGHRPHRWLDMLRAGINVAVGTDSCASSPDLNLVDELRLLHRLCPQVPAMDLWELVTVRAARALGMGDRAGIMQPGQPADLVSFVAPWDNPLLGVLQNPAGPSGVWLGGSRLASADP